MRGTLFLFITGVAVLVGGLLVTWTIFYSGIHESGSFSLNPIESKTFEIFLNGKGIAFYQITIKNYQQQILFIQILDSKNNVIDEQKIQTIMSVNYFDFYHDDNYIIRVSNISEKNIDFGIEFGDTNFDSLIIPFIITFLGCLLVIYVIYRKMMSYIRAHP
jgi:hypothetical protein